MSWRTNSWTRGRWWAGTEVILLLLPAFLLWSCATADAPLNAQALARLQSTKTVAVMPSDVRLALVKLGGAHDELRDLDIAAAQQLGPLVASELSSRGYRVLGAASNASSDIRNAYDQIAYEQKYEVNHPTLESEAPLAEAVAAIAKQTGAEGLVFVELQGIERTGGSVAGEVALDTLIAAGTLGLVIPIKEPNAAAMIRISFIDGKSGAILWSNSFAQTWGLTFPKFGEDDLSTLVKAVFKKFPALGSQAA